MDITWPIAFAKEDVFNPDFMRGILHVAITHADARRLTTTLIPVIP